MRSMSKAQLLGLCKVLTHYRTLTRAGSMGVPMMVYEVEGIDLDALQGLVDRELLGAEGLEAPLKKASWRVKRAAKPARLVPTATVEGHDLERAGPAMAHAIRSSADGVDGPRPLRFIVDTDGTVSARFDESRLGPIAFIKRMGTDLRLAEALSGGLAWHAFTLKFVPELWAGAVPDFELVEVASYGVPVRKRR